MDPMEVFRQIGWFTLGSLLVGAVPLIMAMGYALWPSERRLALMRPLSLAAIFASLAGTLNGFIYILRGVAASSEMTAQSWGRVASGASEALVPLVFGFACLTTAWILVAAGMSRGTRDA